MPPSEPRGATTCGLLAGRRILITGGARGLGRAFAEACAAAGARLVIADLRADLAESTAQALRAAGHAVQAMPLDLADAASVQTCATAAVEPPPLGSFGCWNCFFLCERRSDRRAVAGS